jgi:PAS domain-containing protein
MHPLGHDLLAVFPGSGLTFCCQKIAIQLLWNAKLMPKETDFRQTLEAFPVPVFIFDAGKNPGPIMVNSLMCRLLGYTESELIADWKQVLPPGFLVLAERAIHLPSPEIAVQWNLRKKDGMLISVPLMSRRMVLTRDDSSITEAFFVIAVDPSTSKIVKAEDYFQ